MRFGLAQHQLVGLEDARAKTPPFAVAHDALFRVLRVGHGQRHTLASDGGQQHRPGVDLRHERRARAHAMDQAAHRPAQLQRHIAHLQAALCNGFVKQGVGSGAARRGEGGDEDGIARRQQGAHQRCGTAHLAHGRRMHPHRTVQTGENNG
ncbi:hypothetical protein FQZ97_1116530 [compost metagenome]